jgi:8-oxo-dGTP pyrophosphatase MutT (NUDIX family)
VTDEPKLVPTSRAAEELDVHPSTLWRWQKAGLITPSWTTPGGQARWDLALLRQQLRLPVAAGVITSQRGVLIGRRNDGKPPWTFIAGEIEPGESPADAVVREIKEETGLRVIPAEREIGRRVHPKTGRTMIYIACYPIGGTDAFVGDEDELAEVRWVNLEQAEELLPGMYEPVLLHLARELA